MRSYLTLSAVIFCGFVGVGSTGPFQTLYATALGASLNQVAFVTGVYSTVALVAGLLWGRLADRFQRRKPFVAGAMAGLSLVHLATATISTWEILIPLRLLEGIASGAHQVVSLALMGHILQGHASRGRMISGYRMSGSLAFSVAIVISGWLAQTTGFRGSYLLAAGVYAIAFCIALTLPESAARAERAARAAHSPPSKVQATPPTLPSSPSESRSPLPVQSSLTRSAAEPDPIRASDDLSPSFATLLRSPLQPLLVLAVAYGLPFAAVYSVWPIWVANELGYGRAIYSQLWGLAAFVEVPCMLLCGYFIDRFGRRSTFMLGLGAFALVYLAYLVAPPLPGLIAAQVLRGFAFAAFTATSLTMAIELAPSNARGRAAGLYSTATSLAQISGNWVGAPFAAAVGFRPLYGLAAACLAGAMLYVRFRFSRAPVPSNIPVSPIAPVPITAAR